MIPTVTYSRRMDPYYTAWAAAPIYLYEGDGEWSDDYGNPVDSLWDPFLQLDVAMSAADSYLPQN